MLSDLREINLALRVKLVCASLSIIGWLSLMLLGSQLLEIGWQKAAIPKFLGIMLVGVILLLVAWQVDIKNGPASPKSYLLKKTWEWLRSQAREQQFYAKLMVLELGLVYLTLAIETLGIAFNLTGLVNLGAFATLWSGLSLLVYIITMIWEWRM